MSGFNQRIIQVSENDYIPTVNRSHLAINEKELGDHLEHFCQAEDNKNRTFVFSSLLGGSCHIYCYAPSKELGRDYWTCVTMGMSGTEMKVPAGIEDADKFAHAELMCYLPPDWSFPTNLGQGVTEQSWPFELLRALANYVNATRAWLAECHGLPNLLSDPPGQPFVPNTKLSSVVLLRPLGESEEMQSVVVTGQDEKEHHVQFYLVVPVTAAEAQWKREDGFYNSLAYVIGTKEECPDLYIDYVINPARPCAVEDLGAKALVPVDDSDDEEDDDEDDDEDEDEA